MCTAIITTSSLPWKYLFIYPGYIEKIAFFAAKSKHNWNQGVVKMSGERDA